MRYPTGASNNPFDLARKFDGLEPIHDRASALKAIRNLSQCKPEDRPNVIRTIARFAPDAANMLSRLPQADSQEVE